MATEKVVNLKVNAQGTKDVDQAFKEIKSSINEIDKKAKTAFSPDGAKKLNKELGNTTKVAVDVRQKLRDLQNRMAEIGDVGSAEFQALAAEAGKYKDQMNNANAAIKAMSADFPKLQVGVESLQALGAGAQVGTAAMALFGTENELVAQSIQKMIAIQSLMNAAMSFSNLLSDESAIGLRIRMIRTNMMAKAKARETAATVSQTAAQGSLTIAQKAGAVSMRVLNAVMNANPIFLLITAFAALAGVLAGSFLSSQASAKQAIDDSNEAIDRGNKLMAKAIERNNTLRANALRRAKLEGKSEEELHILKKKLRDTEEEERKIQMKKIENDNAILRKQNELFRYQDNQDELKANIEKINANKDLYEKLALQKQDYILDIQEMDKKEAERQEAERQKEIAKNKAQWQKIKAIRKQRADFEKAIEDQILANKEVTEQTEIEALQVKFERERQAILDNTSITEDQKNRMIEAKEEEARQKRNAISQRYTDELNAALQEADAIREEKEAAEAEALQERLNNELALKKEALDKEVSDREEAEEKKRQLMSDSADMAASGLQAIGDIANLVADNQIEKAEGNEAKQEKIRKKAFNANKAIQLSLAVVDGFKAITTSLAQSPIAIGPIPNPMGIASLAFAALTSAVNIAKIAATKYKSKSASRPSTPSVPTGGSTPQFNVVGASPTNQLAESLAEKENEPVKAFVVAGDVTSAQSLERDKVELSGL